MRLAIVAAIVAALSLGILGSWGARGGSSEDPHASALQSESPAPSSWNDQVFADGEVTFQEYEASIFRYGDCAAERGWKLNVLRLTPRQVYEFELTRPSGSESGPEALRQAAADIRENCSQVYLERVQEAWNRQQQPSESERQAARDDLGACIRGSGYDAPARPSSLDWERFIVVGSGASLEERAAFHSCLASVASGYGLATGQVP